MKVLFRDGPTQLRLSTGRRSIAVTPGVVRIASSVGIGAGAWLDAAGVGSSDASPAGISNRRNGGRSANERVSNGIETLYTGTPIFVAPSGRPQCAWLCTTSDTR